MNLKELKTKLTEKYKSKNLGLVHIDEVVLYLDELENGKSKSNLTEETINTYVERKKQQNL